MSTAARRGAQCESHRTKTQYHSRSAADRALAQIRKFGEHRDGEAKPCRSYECPTCRRWFLTSHPS
jgi:hypothetical protein